MVNLSQEVIQTLHKFVSNEFIDFQSEPHLEEVLEFQIHDSGIGISDDGDVKILQDIYGNVKELFTLCKPCPNKLVPIFSDYTDSSWIKMQDRLALNVEYNGKKYNLLKSPGHFNIYEYIISPSGTCAITFTNSVPIIVYYEEGVSCNTLTGNYLGLDSGSTSFYAINQFTTPLFANNYGKRGTPRV
jgi:hypothetical protein